MNDMEQNKWSEHRLDLTREHLSDRIGLLEACGRGKMFNNKGCVMQHIDDQFGYITPADAAQGKYHIYDLKNDTLLGEFSSIEECIDNGWVIGS